MVFVDEDEGDRTLFVGEASYRFVNEDVLMGDEG